MPTPSLLYSVLDRDKVSVGALNRVRECVLECGDCCTKSIVKGFTCSMQTAHQIYSTGGALPSWLAWLLLHLEIRIKDGSVALAYEDLCGEERALVLSLGTFSLAPGGDGRTTTAALLGLGLAVMRPDANPEPIIRELSVRVDLTHSGNSSGLVPIVTAIAVGAGEDLGQPVMVEVDAGRIKDLVTAHESMRAAFTLRAARRCQPGVLETDFVDAASSLSMLPPASLLLHRVAANNSARATVAVAGVKLLLKLDDTCSGPEVRFGFDSRTLCLGLLAFPTDPTY